MKKLNQNGYQVFSLFLLASYALCDSAHAAPSGTKGGSKRTKDTTPPSVVISSPLSGTVYTTAQSVLISAQASDNIGVSRVEFYRNNALVCSIGSSPFSCNWSISSSNNGSYSWVAKAFDAAGNSASSSIVSLSVNISPPADTQAPSVSITSPLSGTSYTSAQTVTVSASASDNVGVSKVEFYLDGVLKSTVASAPYSYSLSITSALNGSHSLSAKAYDAANNSAGSSAVNISVNIPLPDTQAPSIPSGLQAQAMSSSQINLSWLPSTDNVGVSGYKVYRCQGVGCIPSALLATLSAGSTSYSNSGLLASTTYVYAVSAFDGAGNQSSLSSTASAATQAAPDTQAPSVSITNPLSGASYTTAQTVVVSASASDNVGVSKVEFYLDGVLKSTVASAPYSYSLSITSALNGSHSLSAKAYDAANNVGASSPVSISVNIPLPDTQAPSVSIASPLSGASYTTAQTVVVSASASDNVGVSKVEFYLDGVLKSTVASAPYSYSLSITSALNGSHTLSAKAYDAAGNSATSALVTITINIAMGTPGTPIWSKRFGGQGVDVMTSVAVNTSGDIVMTGTYYGAIDVGGGTLPCASTLGLNYVIAKYRADGSNQWGRCVSAGTGSTAKGNAVAIDDNGNIYVTGSFVGTVTFESQTLTSATASFSDAFVIKYSSDGVMLWVKQFGADSADESLAIALDSGGNIIVTGFLSSPDTIFLRKYSADGVLSWSKGFLGNGSNKGSAVAMDPLNGDILIAGSYYGDSLTMTDGSSKCAISYIDPYASLSSNLLLARFNSSDGSCQWSKTIGGLGEEEVVAIAIDRVTQEIVLAGWFDNNTDLGTGPISGIGREMFLVKYDATATQVKWTKFLTGPYNQSATSMVIDPSSGDVLLAGSFQGTVNTGESSFTVHGAYDFDTDILFVRYSFNGTQLEQKWASAYGGLNADRIYSIAIDKNGKYFVAGGYSMSSTISFDQTLTGAGSADLLMLRMAP